jgi:DNA-binding NtrC family response regulator
MQREVDISRTDIEAAIPRMASASAADPFSRQRGGAFSLKARMSQIERAFVEDAMEDAGGSQTRAAELLKLSQQALSKKLLKWDSE